MDTREIMQKIKNLDSEISGLNSLAQNLTGQISEKEKKREMWRKELKVAFAKKNDLKQPSAKHADLYTE